MTTSIYIVLVKAEGQTPSTKAFQKRVDANSFAKNQVEGDAERAEIYEIEGVDDARKATAALKLGHGKLIGGTVKHATQKQINLAMLWEELL